MNRRLVKQMYVEAATSLFEERGYDNVTVDDIAVFCKKSRTNFYHYFTSKDDLMIYLSEIEKESYADILKEIDLVFVDHPDKRLMKLLVDRMMLLYNSSFFKIAIKNNLFERMKEMQAIRDEFDKAHLKQCLRIVKEGIRLGCFVPLDKIATFYQFYQPMQHGVENSLFDRENDQDVITKYLVIVELAIKAITLNGNDLMFDDLG